MSGLRGPRYRRDMAPHEQLSTLARDLLEPAPPRWAIGIRAAVVAVLAAAVLGVGLTAFSAVGSTTRVTEATDVDGLNAADAAAPVAVAAPGVHVHVLGAVRQPGVYRLPIGARAVDAVAAAGGLTDQADASGVNLAAVIDDGMQLVVPTLRSDGARGAVTQVADSRVNLNTATVAELEALPRIGPALASRIVAWRDTHGPFRRVDDLLSVSGIGQKTFTGLQPLVRVR